MMSLTVDKLLSDARTLISRLKEQDCNADSIMSTSQVLHRRIEAMKQYQDDITELNEMAKHRPRSSLVLGLAQENRRIRELQQEKQELGVALEEHQSALQLIMHKYRQHTVRLLHANRLDATLRSRHAPSKEEVCRLLDKVEEMASVMQQAIHLDDANTSATQERISRLERENHTLRQLLEICALPPPAPADADAAATTADGSPSLAVDQNDSSDSQPSSQQGEGAGEKESTGGGVEDTREEEGEGSKPDGSETPKS